jgi:hypothetical protein
VDPIRSRRAASPLGSGERHTVPRGSATHRSARGVLKSGLDQEAAMTKWTTLAWAVAMGLGAACSVAVPETEEEPEKKKDDPKTGSGPSSASGSDASSGAGASDVGPGGPSCAASCGSPEAAPGSDPPCFCDAACVQNGDCCADYRSACGGGASGSGSGSGSGGGATPGQCSTSGNACGIAGSLPCCAGFVCCQTNLPNIAYCQQQC